jgi:hypothetical protein
VDPDFRPVVLCLQDGDICGDAAVQPAQYRYPLEKGGAADERQLEEQNLLANRM